MRLLPALLLLPFLVGACDRPHDRVSGDLARDSGVTGAGAGPSTRAALATSPSNAGPGSSEQNNAPNAGGPH